jgi:hypothetical protein
MKSHMSYLGAQVTQEDLAIGFLIGVFIGAALALFYLLALGRFFKFLCIDDHEAWVKMGKPTIVTLLLMPHGNFQQFYAFYPILKRYYQKGVVEALMPWRLLHLGLIYFAMMIFYVLYLISIL